MKKEVKFSKYEPRTSAVAEAIYFQIIYNLNDF